jgi:hypothetical protein
MSHPDVLSPRRPRCYIFTKRALAAAAIVPLLKSFGVF